MEAGTDSNHSLLQKFKEFIQNFEIANNVFPYRESLLHNHKFLLVDIGDLLTRSTPTFLPKSALPRRYFVPVRNGSSACCREFEDFSSEQGNDNGRYWSNATFEAVIGEGVKLSHSYIQTQSFRAARSQPLILQAVAFIFMDFAR